MKREVPQFVFQYLTCQLVKAKYQRPRGLLQSLSISEQKWEHITMDFVTSLSRTLNSNNAIWIIMDRLTKSTHFLAYKVILLKDQLSSILRKQ